MKRRVYSPEERAQALVLVAERGLSHASRETGIPKANLSRWAKRDGVKPVPSERNAAALAALEEKLEERRERLGRKLLAIAELCAERADMLIAEANLRDTIGALDYTLKNHQLLSGRATSRVEHRDTIDAEIERLSAEIAKVPA